MSSYWSSLKRFKLVIAAGVVLGAALALTSAYKVDFGTFPFELTERETPTYTAGTQLEVTSPQAPYYRSAVDVPVLVPTVGGEEEEDEEPATLTEEDEPAVSSLVTAANYYPYVIEGDDVKALRERMFGVIDGQIEATAIGATLTPSRQEPGRLPFIQIVATSDSPQHTIDLAQQTAQAFIRYVLEEQQRRGIRPEQRLIVKELRAPDQTFQVSGTSMNLPILIFVLLTLVAVAIAFLLDRMFPSRPEALPATAGDGDDTFLGQSDRDEPLVAASGRKG